MISPFELDKKADSVDSLKRVKLLVGKKLRFAQSALKTDLHGNQGEVITTDLM